MSRERPVVLCVDDDQAYLDTTRVIVEAAGCTMLEAHSAEEALRGYRQSAPDLLIVDLMMEEVDAGTGLVKELRLLGNTAPVYLLSSVGDTLTLTTDVSALGLAGVLQKPIAPDVLLAILRARFTATAPE